MTGFGKPEIEKKTFTDQGPVVQSIVSLTKSLVNDSLSLLVRLKSSVLIVFSAKNGSVFMYNMFEILTSRLRSRLVRVITVWTDRSEEPSGQGHHCLPFSWNLLDQLFCNEMILFQFKEYYSNFLGVQMYWIFTVT